MRPLLVALLLLVPGCLTLAGPSECPAPSGWVLAGPETDEGRITAFGSSHGYHRLLYAIQGPTNETANLSFAFGVAGDDGGTWTGGPFASDADKSNRTLLGAATPTFNVQDTIGADRWDYEARLRLARPACTKAGELAIPLRFMATAPGAQAYPGVGVQALTAGFWTNGTLFYTNMERVHTDLNITRAGWYKWEGDDPLPVYIYNETRTERPERYNRSGFITTIPGFNQALKNIFVGTSFVAQLEPHEAYTRPGSERHQLYGDELVFYIEITDVVAIDCPLPQPVCEAPTPPPAPDAQEPPAQGGSTVSPAAFD